MGIIISILGMVVMLAVTTVVLAAALSFVGEEINRDTLVKCFGINLVASLFGLIPVIGLLSVVVWLAALMSVFERSFKEALVIALACTAIMFVVFMGLELIFGTQTGGEEPTLVIHAHDGAFDLIDRSGTVIRTAESVEGVVKAINEPEVSAHIVHGRVKLRGEHHPSGIPKGKAGELVGELLTEFPVVQSVQFEDVDGPQEN